MRGSVTVMWSVTSAQARSRTRSGCGMMRLAHEVVVLVIEGRVEEEALVLELEVLVLLADPALAQGQQLLALGKRAHGNRPFLECNWHKREKPQKSSRPASIALRRRRARRLILAKC